MPFDLEFTDSGYDDYLYWKKLNDPKVLTKIKSLLENMISSPFDGIGKPEALKHQLSGYWSRRINREHRIVYTVDDTTIYIISMRYHYSK